MSDGDWEGKDYSGCTNGFRMSDHIVESTPGDGTFTGARKSNGDTG